jgi:hypothetical protein
MVIGSWQVGISQTQMGLSYPAQLCGHFDWSSHYLLQLRGQSHCATWQKRLTEWGTENFHYRQFRSLERESLHCPLLSQRTAVRIFVENYTLTSQIARAKWESQEVKKSVGGVKRNYP